MFTRTCDVPKHESARDPKYTKSEGVRKTPLPQYFKVQSKIVYLH